MLVDKVNYGAGFVASLVRLLNTVGTLVTTGVSSVSGHLIADEYTLVLSGLSGGLGTITVTTLSPNNPYNGRVINSVNIGAGELRKDVVPGTDLTFSNTAVNGNTAIIKVGTWAGNFNSADLDAVPQAGIRHQVENTGPDIGSVKATLKEQAILVNMTGTVFSSIEPFAPGAIEKVAGGGSERVMPYVMTVINVSGGEADLQIDGALFGAGTIRDLVTVTGLLLNSDNLLLDNKYEVVSGPLMGLVFVLSSSAVNNDEANILIFSSRYIQIAEDLNGVEGSYGITDVNITQQGQSTGVILSLQVAYYWSRIYVPEASNGESNPYPCQIKLSGIVSSGAGWGG